MDKITKLDGGTLEERIREMKEFFGLREDQSFQDLDVDIDDEDEEDEDEDD